MCSAACCFGCLERWEGVRNTFSLRLAALDEKPWYATWVQALQAELGVLAEIDAAKFAQPRWGTARRRCLVPFYDGDVVDIAIVGAGQKLVVFAVKAQR